MNEKLRQYFAEYDSYHTTRGNEACHFAGIPLIMLALFAMLRRLDLVGPLDAALLLIAVAFLFYVTLSFRLAFAMLVLAGVLYLVSLWLPFRAAVVLFVVGWILQFVGHGVFEKRAPAFSSNVMHLMVGPLWILNRALDLER